MPTLRRSGSRVRTRALATVPEVSESARSRNRRIRAFSTSHAASNATTTKAIASRRDARTAPVPVVIHLKPPNPQT